MRRREFIAGLGSAAAWPVVARAQQPPMPVIGYLGSGSLYSSREAVPAFHRGLSETGYIEGRNVAVEYRWAEDRLDRLPELAADLVRRQVAVIFTVGDFAPALVAKAATTRIPIVFASGGDPVSAGLVRSFNRPGANVTGVTGMSGELAGKQLGLLHAMVPGAKRFAVLVNPTNPQVGYASFVTDVKPAAAVIGVEVDALTATSNRDIDAAFASLAQKRAEAVLMSADPLFLSRRVQLATLAVKYAIPTISWNREYAEAGGLMSYGPSIADVNRQAGVYAGRILKGEKPADLPVMQASKFEFVINLQTARTLGFEVPATMLALADEVIE